MSELLGRGNIPCLPPFHDRFRDLEDEIRRQNEKQDSLDQECKDGWAIKDQPTKVNLVKNMSSIE